MILFKIFSTSKIQAAQLSSSHASVISWSINPVLARPDVMNRTDLSQLTTTINNALTKYQPWLLILTFRPWSVIISYIDILFEMFNLWILRSLKTLEPNQPNLIRPSLNNLKYNNFSIMCRYRQLWPRIYNGYNLTPQLINQPYVTLNFELS